MPGQISGGQRDPGDDGSAAPGVSAALAAYGAGEAGEHTALLALAQARLLVPLIPVPAGDDECSHGHGEAHRHGGTEMARPTLVGQDGRHAVPAFTCLEALMRWRRDARPVPVPAAEVWQAGRRDASAVVIDVAGPVPLAVEGPRLDALAAGQSPPPPHEDPEVLAAARDAVAGETVFAGVSLSPGGGSDLMLHLRLAPGAGAGEQRVRAAAQRAAGALLAAVGPRLHRGIEVTLAVGGSAPCCAG